MARIIHFDVLVKDIDRACRFYESAFGWSIQKWDGPMEYWLASTGKSPDEGIDGGIAVGEPNLKDGQLTLGVESLEESLEAVTAAGGTVVQGKAPIQGVGYFATVGDTEGNVFGLMSSDSSAK